MRYASRINQDEFEVYTFSIEVLLCSSSKCDFFFKFQRCQSFLQIYANFWQKWLVDISLAKCALAFECITDWSNTIVQAYIHILFQWRMFVCSVASSQYTIYRCNLSLIESNRNANLIPMGKLKQIWMEFHFHEIHIQRKPFPSIFIVFPCLVITLTNQSNLASIYVGANTFHLIQTAKVVHAIYLSIQQLPYCSSRITLNLSILTEYKTFYMLLLDMHTLLNWVYGLCSFERKNVIRLKKLVTRVFALNELQIKCR